MTGRLAARAADAEALLARFNAASEHALQAIARGDADALTQALDVRDALRHEIERALREVALVRSRFAAGAAESSSVRRVVEQAVDGYCSPLDHLVRAAQALQEQLEASATRFRAGLLEDLASLDAVAGAAARYSAPPAMGPSRVDVVL